MATIKLNESTNQSPEYIEYLNLCKEGRIIEAVKIYKDKTGCSLVEVKKYIDNLRVENGLAAPSGNSRSGCMVLLVV